MGQVASGIASGMKTTMDENFKRQMDFQMDAFQMQLERQLAMQNEMRERQMSMQIARAREIVKYYGTFYAVLALGCTAGAIKTKKGTPLIPLVPLGFVLTFQLDSAYGNLIQRARTEAEKIMTEERDMLKLPYNMPTFDLIEAKRLAAKK
uniref:Plasminogen receptor (KT) n=1 Tax=Phallusia mammillata TaxID=59560 RepID=A0A6F9DPM5_9ASCI|nr:plasminogen receptor (KT) [Phallusia mammillata]